MTVAAPSLRQPIRSYERTDIDRWSQRLAIIVIAAAMGLLIVAPLAVVLVTSATSDAGVFVGVRNFITYFADGQLRQSLLNTLVIGSVTMVVTVGLAFPFAYAISCTAIPLKKTLFVLCMLPLYAPTMLYGIGLYSLFGNQGLLSTGFFGRIPLHLPLYIHGLTGIVLAETLSALPPAVLVLSVALSHRDRRLYEAADSMGASILRTFWTITLPMCRAGLISAAAIAFVQSTTDYGAPEMLAERTNVLALDIAGKALGMGRQNDRPMGAVISLVLLIPTVIACSVQFIMRRRQTAALTARSVPMPPTSQPLRDWLLLSLCLAITFAIVLVTTAPVIIAFARNWPYSLYPDLPQADGARLTLANFNFTEIGQATGGGMSAFTNSLFIAGLTAIAGTFISFVAAYLIERTNVLLGLRHLARAAALIPLGLPGMVLGLAYILIFNPLNWGPFPNPTAGLYGTVALLVICNIVHYLGVSFLTASAAIGQLDAEFEHVAASLAVPLWRLFLQVTVPVCLPAIIEIAMYYFVSAMTTVSAVIFLVSVKTPLASVAIINLKDSGNLEPAAAMAVLILLSNVIVRAAAEPVIRFFRGSTQRWQTHSV